MRMQTPDLQYALLKESKHGGKHPSSQKGVAPELLSCNIFVIIVVLLTSGCMFTVLTSNITPALVLTMQYTLANLSRPTIACVGLEVALGDDQWRLGHHCEEAIPDYILACKHFRLGKDREGLLHQPLLLQPEMQPVYPLPKDLSLPGQLCGSSFAELHHFQIKLCLNL